MARFLPELLARTWAADRAGKLLLVGSVRAAMGSDWLISDAGTNDPNHLELLKIDDGARLTSRDLKGANVRADETASAARARWYEVRASELASSLPELVERSRDIR